MEKFYTPMEGAAMKQRISRFSLSIALIYPFSYGQAALLEMTMEAAYNYAKSKLTMLTAAGFNPKIPISIGFIFSAYFVSNGVMAV